MRVVKYVGGYDPLVSKIIDRLDGRILVEWPDGARTWYSEVRLQECGDLVRLVHDYTLFGHKKLTLLERIRRWALGYE